MVTWYMHQCLPTDHNRGLTGLGVRVRVCTQAIKLPSPLPPSQTLSQFPWHEATRNITTSPWMVCSNPITRLSPSISSCYTTNLLVTITHSAITRYVRGKCTIWYQSQVVILGKLSNVPKIIQMSFSNGSCMVNCVILLNMMFCRLYQMCMIYSLKKNGSRKNTEERTYQDNPWPVSPQRDRDRISTEFRFCWVVVLFV